MAKAAEATPESDISMADVAALIRQSNETIAALRKELAEVRESVPHIRPMDKPVDPTIARRDSLKNLVKGEQAGGVIATVPTDFRGHTVGAGTAAPRFRDRDPIRLRPDVSREGFPKEGDPFPVKYDVDLRGRKRVSRDWAMWSRIFPDMKEAGDTFPRDVVWGDLLAANRCSGEGIIIYPGVMSRLGVWKYRIRVPGITQDQGDSAYEFELQAAS